MYQIGCVLKIFQLLCIIYYVYIHLFISLNGQAAMGMYLQINKYDQW